MNYPIAVITVFLQKGVVVIDDTGDATKSASVFSTFWLKSILYMLIT